MLPGKKQNEDVDIEDSEHYLSSTESLEIKQIVLRQLQKTIIEGAKEMDRGGIRERVVNGQVINIIVGNQREVFVNNIDMLWSLILPQVQANKDLIKEHLGNFNKDLKTNQEEYDSTRKQIKKDITTLEQSEKTKTWKSNYSAILNDMLRRSQDNFELRKLEIYRRKLNAVNFLLDKLNYFGETGATG